MNRKFKLNELDVINYDVTRRAGRAILVDWVTESTYLSDKNLSREDFNKVIQKHHQIAGELRYKKYRQIYASGLILYKHILKEVMY